jgi:hypothetical protein
MVSAFLNSYSWFSSNYTTTTFAYVFQIFHDPHIFLQQCLTDGNDDGNPDGRDGDHGHGGGGLGGLGRLLVGVDGAQAGLKVVVVVVVAVVVRVHHDVAHLQDVKTVSYS